MAGDDVHEHRQLSTAAEDAWVQLRLGQGTGNYW